MGVKLGLSRLGKSIENVVLEEMFVVERDWRKIHHK
jgi:hypothetical protein